MDILPSVVVYIGAVIAGVVLGYTLSKLEEWKNRRGRH
jgi:hypothetical protein